MKTEAYIAYMDFGPGLVHYTPTEHTDPAVAIASFIDDRRDRMMPISVERRGTEYDVLALDFKSKKWRCLRVGLVKERM